MGDMGATAGPGVTHRDSRAADAPIGGGEQTDCQSVAGLADSMGGG